MKILMRTKMILVPVAMLALLFTEMTAHAGIVDGTALARPEKFFLIQVDADFHNSDKLLKLNLSVDARGPGLPVGSLEFFAVVHDARPGVDAIYTLVLRTEPPMPHQLESSLFSFYSPSFPFVIVNYPSLSSTSIIAWPKKPLSSVLKPGAT